MRIPSAFCQWACARVRHFNHLTRTRNAKNAFGGFPMMKKIGPHKNIPDSSLLEFSEIGCNMCQIRTVVYANTFLQFHG